MARPDPLPAHITADQIRAAFAALGLDVLEFTHVRHVAIDPYGVTVETARTDEDGHLLATAGSELTTTSAIGIKWSKPKDAAQ